MSKKLKHTRESVKDAHYSGLEVSMALSEAGLAAQPHHLYALKPTVRFSQYWAMPNKDTFTIKPIGELVARYVNAGGIWIDPMAGNNSPAQITNDMNPDTSAKHHMDAKTFLDKMVTHFDGVLFDPPYSPRQVSEMYKGFGGKATSWDTTMSYYSKLKDAIVPLINIGGHAISFGWNSNGFGKWRGFETVEIMLVKHGGWHNDTIVTVEKKIHNIKKI